MPDKGPGGQRVGLLTVRGRFVDGKIVLLDDVPIQGTHDVLITFLDRDDFVVLHQEDYLSMAEAASNEAAVKARNLLTNREYEVLELLQHGLTNKEIAIELRLSTGTVRNYASSIYNKLDVRNRIEAVTRAVELGLLPMLGERSVR
jgi:DNA-binding CsgD family transcriptional regulator